MVKKFLLLFASLSLIILVVMYIITNINLLKEYDLKKIENASVDIYEKNVKYDLLPNDCLSILNDKYCICKEAIDLNLNSNQQYGQNKETIYLHNMKNGSREKLIECEKNVSTFNYISGGNKIFWIEHYVSREEMISGNWSIKQYDLNTKEIKIIDKGGFDNFEKFAFKDIDFSNSSMLFPSNLDISDNKLVYNRIIDINDGLVFEIVMYNLKSGKSKVIAVGNDYRNEYLYDVAISGDYVVYNKYHDKNNDNSFRPTTYKYCDLFMYNINEESTEQITNNDFLINLDMESMKLTVARVPESVEKQNIFARMQIVVIDLKNKTREIVLHHKSPIYNDRQDLAIGNPTFLGKYLVWQDNTLSKHMYIYNCYKNKFERLPFLNETSDFSIAGAAENSLLILETTKNGEVNLYRLLIS